MELHARHLDWSFSREMERIKSEFEDVGDVSSLLLSGYTLAFTLNVILRFPQYTMLPFCCLGEIG